MFHPSSQLFSAPKTLFLLFFVFFLLTAACDKFPVFNIFGERENKSEHFTINPVLRLDQIKRIGSVYGTPGAGEGGTPHNGIDIGVDPGTLFVAGCPGVIVNIARGHDENTEVADVELRYNEEYSISYLFEPERKIFVKVGDIVSVGDLIGSVGNRESGFIDQCVHFWVKRKGQAVCPVPFLRADFRKRLNDVYRTRIDRNPNNLCACPEHQHYFVE
ncbi:MAG: M23 family metallopeptidase [Candidatus Aminicenantes bacterium]|nr:M23 family metallopeptidase [Candidatus Aminicenantes bacterium]